MPPSARLLAQEGLRVGLAARRIDKLAVLRDEVGALAFACDAADPAQVARLFDEVADEMGEPDV